MFKKLSLLLLASSSLTAMEVKDKKIDPDARKVEAQGIFGEKYKGQLTDRGKLTIIAPEDKPNEAGGEVYSVSYVNRWAFDRLCGHWFDLEIAERDGVGQRNYPKVPEHATYCDFEKFEPGQRVCVRNIRDFLNRYSAYLDTVQVKDIVPIVVVSVGDYKTSMKDQYIDQVLKNPRLKKAISHWFGIHPTPRCVTNEEFSKLFTSVPLGPWQIWKRYQRREEMKVLFELLRKFAEKKQLLYWNAGPFNESRRRAAEHFKKQAWCLWKAGGVKLENCLLENAESIAVADTEGWGPDCYRIVEVALGGSFVVRLYDVALEELYKRLGVPVLWIHEDNGVEWQEQVTPELLIKTSNEFCQRTLNYDKLFMTFFENALEKASEEARETYLKERLDSPLAAQLKFAAKAKSEADVLKYIAMMQNN